MKERSRNFILLLLDPGVCRDRGGAGGKIHYETDSGRNGFTSSAIPEFAAWSIAFRQSRAVRFLTASANAENLQTVMSRLETELTGDALLLRLDEFVVELDHQTARRANQMIMM